MTVSSSIRALYERSFTARRSRATADYLIATWDHFASRKGLSPPHVNPGRGMKDAHPSTLWVRVEDDEPLHRFELWFPDWFRVALLGRHPVAWTQLLQFVHETIDASAKHEG